LLQSALQDLANCQRFLLSYISTSEFRDRGLRALIARHGFSYQSAVQDKMDWLALTDAEQIVRLVSEAADPTIERPIPERKRAIMCGVADLVDADIWYWCTVALSIETSANPRLTSFIDGGWHSDQERVQFLHAINDPNARDWSTQAYELCRDRHLTIGPEFFLSEKQQQQIDGFRTSTGVGHFLWSFYALDKSTNSAVGLFRRTDKSPFSDRDRVVVHVVFQQVDWLHRFGSDVPARDKVLDLSPREREVLLFLLGGDSQKEVARKLELSEYTVGDYVKNVYRHFQVSSRGELLAHFISGRHR
jgi:DNA-binding CsgD family transcriptional regulator